MTGRYRWLLLAAAVLSFLLIVAGGVVCLTDASGGCPDWPACYGRLVPPARLDSILEYTHRVIAGSTAVLVFASAGVAWRRYPTARWLWRPTAAASVLVVAVALFGASVVLHGLAPAFAMLDLGSALSMLGLIVAATVVAFRSHGGAVLSDRVSWSAPGVRLASWTVVAVLVVLVSGILVATPGSAVRCLGWPLFGGGLDAPGARRWLALGRLALTVGATVLMALLAARVWRAPRQRREVRRMALALGLMLALSVVTGAVAALLGSPVWLLAMLALLATGLWSACIALLAMLALPAA